MEEKPGPPDETDPRKPFTVRQNIQQLCAIDKSIAQLMTHTSTALAALAPPGGHSSKRAADEQDAQKTQFHESTDAFLGALHRVDVLMKRQIWGLEEAGIVTLRGGGGMEAAGDAGDVKNSAGGGASLKTNGVGDVGNLDVGWLNSRGTRVEREMEAELWERARGMLEERTGEREGLAVG